MPTVGSWGMRFLVSEVPLQLFRGRSWQKRRGGGADVIRKEAWPFYRTISGVRLCWELEEPKGPEASRGWRGAGSMALSKAAGVPRS